MGGSPRDEACEQLLAAMKRVSRVLADSEVPHALAGGMAVYARGGTASDHDVDFLIRARDTDAALAALADAGLRTERPPEPWLVKAYHEDVLVDLIHNPVDRPVTDETLAGTDVMNVGAVWLPVLSGTELMIHRLLTFTEHYCDFAGAIAVARSIREQIDWPVVRDETRHSAFARAFLQLLESLDVTPAVAAPVGSR
jgi:hypothetical protein